MDQKGYRKLIVWQKADEFSFQIYFATKSFPKEELYGITSQLRRAALSVPTNIAEGYGRQGRKELKQFINIALGVVGGSGVPSRFLFKAEIFKFGDLSNSGEIAAGSRKLALALLS